MTKTEFFNREQTITEFNAESSKFAIGIHQFRLKMSEFEYIIREIEVRYRSESKLT